ncbi:MAG TPA: hypothetical protein VL371_15135, partial [Gemmataceae bacterium]|nr:hypothetical protein [Gemmataceae bacterium]
RLRREHGEDPSAEEYACRYGVTTDDWPTGPAGESDPADELLAASVAYRRYRAAHNTDEAPKFVSPKAKTALVGDAMELFVAVRDSNSAWKSMAWRTSPAIPAGRNGRSSGSCRSPATR